MNTILFTISEQIKNISILLSPIIPISTQKVLNIMNLDDKDVSLDTVLKGDILKHEVELKDLDILFKKIEDDN